MPLCNAYNRFVWLKVLTKKTLAQQTGLAYLQYSIFVLNDRLRLMKITMFIKPLKRVNIIKLDICHNKYKATVAQMDMKKADVMYNQNRTTAISFSQ